MAQTHSKLVPVSETYSHREFNVSRLSGDYGSDAQVKITKASMIREGWRMDANGTLLAVLITDEWKGRAVTELTAKWEQLRESVKTDPKVAPFLHVFEANRIKGNKVIVPKYMLDSGNRRNAILDEVNVARYEAQQPLIVEFPVIVRHFENEMERIIAQMLDNMGKLEGFVKPSEKDMLLCGQVILAKGGIQDDIRRAFTGTTGQKIFGILTLDKRFPEVKLLERLINTDATHPTFLRYGPIKGPKLPNLVLRSDSKALAKKNLEERTAGLPETQALTAEGLEKFLTGEVTTNEPKIMDKKNIIQLASEANPCNVGRAYMQAVTSNSTDLLGKFIANASVFNACESLCDKGIGPDLDTILCSLLKSNDLSVAVKSVKEALKV